MGLLFGPRTTKLWSNVRPDPSFSRGGQRAKAAGGGLNPIFELKAVAAAPLARREVIISS